MAAFRRVLLFALVGLSLALILCVGESSMAQNVATNDDDLFTARDVVVDVSSDNAARARDEAVAKAQMQALDVVIKRLGDDKATLPPDAAKRLDELVGSFEVQNERRSAKRYIGTFTVHLRPAAVRALVTTGGAGGGAVTTVTRKPVLVLPLVVTGEQAILWESRTPWRMAWEGIAAQKGLVPFIVPAGGVRDITLLGSTEALMGDQAAIMKLAARYGADSALRISVSEPLAPEGASITLRRFDAQGAHDMPPITVPAQPGEAPAAWLTRAARVASEQLTESWKRQAAVDVAGPVQTLIALALTPDLATWAEMDKRLRSTTALEKRELLTQTRRSARIALSFHGTPEQLAVLLEQSDLLLTRQPDGQWMLALRHMPAAP